MTSTPIKLPSVLTPDLLAKHISTLAKRINDVLTRNRSVKTEDKNEILGLTKAIVDATPSITNVMEPQTMVNNIDATDLIASVRDEIAKLREEFNQTSNVPNTFADVVRSSKTKLKTPVSRPAIVIASTQPSDKHTDVINVWRKKVSFKEENYAPARLQRVANNKVRIEFDDIKQRDSTLEKLKNINSLKAEEAKRLRPMMIIKGVHNSTEESEVLELVKSQNPTLNVTEASDIRLCFLRKNRNANLYNVVLEVAPQVRFEMLALKRLNVDHQRVFVGDFSQFKQCYKCLQFGHTKSKCTSNVEACSHCASPDHSYKDCPDNKDTAKLRCYNCHTHNVNTNANVNDAHSATSAKHCPRVKALIQRINERIDYGC